MLESSYRLRPSVIGRGQFLRFQMAEFEDIQWPIKTEP